MNGDEWPDSLEQGEYDDFDEIFGTHDRIYMFDNKCRYFISGIHTCVVAHAVSEEGALCHCMCGKAWR